MSLPFDLYRNDPLWVAPLRRDESRRWSPKFNDALNTRWVRRFLAYRGDTPVGRIAAIVDRRFEQRWEAHTGWFGFFECTNDAEAARGLFEAAEKALRGHGLRRVVGPVNLTPHDETGILIHGFDSRPMVMSPYNPAFYLDLIERAGYRKFRDYHSFLASSRDEPSPVVQRLARSARTGLGPVSDVCIRPLDTTHWDRDVKILFDLYNSSFHDVWGFVPISERSFLKRAKMFRPIVRPELAPIAEIDGQPVGFALVLPDINEALSLTNGRLFPTGWWKIVRRIPHIRSGRFILLGVKPNVFGRGIGALLALAIQQGAAKVGIDQFECSLVQATNKNVRRVIDAFGCPIAKTYRLYQRDFTCDISTEAAA